MRASPSRDANPEHSLLIASGESGGLMLGAPVAALLVGAALLGAGDAGRQATSVAWLWIGYAVSAAALAAAPRALWNAGLLLNGLMLQACVLGAAWLQGWGLNGGSLFFLPPAMVVLALMLPQRHAGLLWITGVAGLVSLWVWHHGTIVHAGPLLPTQAPATTKALLLIGAHTLAVVTGLMLGQQLRGRMQREALLKARYRDFFEQVPMGVLVHREGRIIDANGTAAQILGAPHGLALAGEPVLSIVADDASRQRMGQLLDELNSLSPGQQLPRAQLRLQSLGGRNLDCGIVCSRVMLADGPASISMFTDETVRLAMESSLRWSLSLQERLVASSPLAIAVALADTGRLVMANEAASELTGYSIEELLAPQGDGSQALWPQTQELRDIEEQLEAHGVSAEKSITLHTRAGVARQVRIWASVFRVDGEGYRVWLGQDITQQEHDRVERERVMERARREAEAASRAKSAFLANTSHELRTPMNAIIGLSQLAVAPGVTDEQRLAFMRQIHESSRGLLHMVSEVLDLAKIEAGALDLEDIEFDLHELLTQLHATYIHLAHEKGLSLLWRTPSGAAGHRVRGDPTRLRQVLHNLLSNALKFTEEGSVRLTVWRISPMRVCIEVMDTGPGIPEDVQTLIFEPFAQADTSTTRRFGGTGLGLSIVREICQRMDGHCDVSSTPGQGSRFWCVVDLPVVGPEADTARSWRTSTAAAVGLSAGSPHEAAPSASDATAEPDVQADADANPAEIDRPASESPPAPISLAGRRILVVEDNPINRMIVTLMLEQRGGQAITAHDGRQALELLGHLAEQSALPDAVLMDMQMPEMDGKATTRALRCDPALAALPVIALTAGATVEEREEAIASGMDDYLTKPVDIDELVRRLDARIQSASGTPALSPACPPA